MYNYLAVAIVMISVLSGMLCISMLVYDVHNAIDDNGDKMSFIQSRILEQRKREIIRLNKKVEELEKENSILRAELRWNKEWRERKCRFQKR